MLCLLSAPAAWTNPIQTPPPLPPAPQPVLRDLVIEGATVFSRSEILRWLDLKLETTLPSSPEELAKRLERKYDDEGYSFAKVAATYDEANGRLTLTLDEGKVDGIEFEGIDERLAKRFEQEFEIQAGDVFNRRDAAGALNRLLAPARGAVKPGGGKDVAPAGGQPAGEGARGPFDLVDRGGKRVLVVRLTPRTGKVTLTTGTESREDWFTPVDGFTPALGFNATIFDDERFNHTHVEGYLSYKFAREEVGYALGLERPLFDVPKLYLGGSLHDLSGSDDNWRLSTGEQSLAALAFKNTFRDYYRRRGYQLHAVLRVESHQEVAVRWRDERHETLDNQTNYSFWRDAHFYRANAAAESGRLHAVVLSYGWDSRGFERESTETTYRRHQLDDLYGSRGGQKPGWRLEWSSEIASADALGGDFTFRRHILNLRRYSRLSLRQHVNTRLLVGLSDGRVPPQRTFALGGIGSVHGFRFKEAVGERMALVNVDYKLKLRDKLTGVAFFDVGRVFRPRVGSRDDWMRGVGLGFELGDSFRVDFGWRLEDIPQSLQVQVRLRPLF